VLVVNAGQSSYTGDVVVWPSNWDLRPDELISAAVKVFTAGSLDRASTARHAKENPAVLGAAGAVRIPVQLAGRSVQVLEFHL
jgi:hypothetical protein